ncbi:4-hydroxy-tetrahydrodipicolinate reductase [Ilumatobacter sp.]|uniref:4-hydroxy-tetrahydrodipicolinate reductase n=1 Tax=Ilumatobacter sp. TaxID=1967498 RepID=UPI003B51FFDA
MAQVRVGVNGAAGRMGRAVCAAVDADAGLELVVAVDRIGSPAADGGAPGVGDVELSGDLHAFADAACDVVVDFTVAEAARTTLPWLGMHGIHAVVGTTGFSDDDLALFASSFSSADEQTGPNCVIAANFAISAVLMMRFAEMAAPHFDTAEVIELHHTDKVDAPSGTAVTTIERMAAARDSDFAADPTEVEVYPGARGGAGPRGIRAHSVRMRGMVAHQEVVLGAQGQTITIRQDSYDRSSFMPGVVLACRRIADHPGLTIGLDAFLDVG